MKVKSNSIPNPCSGFNPFVRVVAPNDSRFISGVQAYVSAEPVIPLKKQEKNNVNYQ